MSDSPNIRLSADVFRQYQETIAKHPPETYAILGGRLDDPYHVTDFRFCPPRLDDSRRYDASATHVNIDPHLMNFIIDHEWVPNGKYCLGLWHSHPGSYSQLSCGDYDTNEGDLTFFSSCLEHDDSPGKAWRHFLAPITTFRSNGDDDIHGWIVDRDDPTPRRCAVVVEPNELARTIEADHLQAQARVVLAHSEHRLAFARDLLLAYAKEISAIVNNPGLSPRDRRSIIAGLTRLRDGDLRDLVAGRHPLSKLLSSTSTDRAELQ